MKMTHLHLSLCALCAVFESFLRFALFVRRLATLTTVIQTYYYYTLPLDI